jgi:hypothetical protein
MTADPQQSSSHAGAGSPAAAEERLDAVEAALRRHLAAEADPPPQAVADLARQLDELSHAVARMAPESAAACLTRARRIRRLHDQLALRLLQQRDETRARLAQIGKGKATLNAYRRNA